MAEKCDFCEDMATGFLAHCAKHEANAERFQHGAQLANAVRAYRVFRCGTETPDTGEWLRELNKRRQAIFDALDNYDSDGLRKKVFDNLDNAKENGYFEPKAYLAGATAREIAGDLVAFASDLEDEELETLVPHCQAWLERQTGE